MAGAVHRVRDLAALTRAERALLDAMRDGKTLAEAAQALGISYRTATRRLFEVRDKFGVETAQEAVEKWKGQDTS